MLGKEPQVNYTEQNGNKREWMVSSESNPLALDYNDEMPKKEGGLVVEGTNRCVGDKDIGQGSWTFRRYRSEVTTSKP